MTAKHKLEEAARKLDHLTMDSLWADLERLRAVNAELVKALQELLNRSEQKPVLTGHGVKAVREAGKFMAALTQARAALANAKAKE